MCQIGSGSQIGGSRAEQSRAGPNQQKERAVKPDSSLCQVQFHRSLLTSKRVELTMGSYLLVLMVAGLASSHEYFPEKCPEFQPMQGFDWDQVLYCFKYSIASQNNFFFFVSDSK